ncbi:heparan-alpha-glucosaminide N-acetyltransferase [Salpingoeca rosetta]|uniref:Heparan-alpha-glucosaminide N-acetyltransferase n=1 Tax=Salpingoeca rosetta (strain ATCC 50818 / BSB-021) TaxID=946362 RepID=F2UAS7_SALR5|nr:heparan-alpha-glucosaminide N-acetyltransferase [Salpingoeca rosetta]EGD73493.1 heparan-alpha-glucosaminide N-acetyltransferase [Salpingoeca rosetta]|eukprot:XP_004993775.1 heparan-alpha-glucosaminide N-acetyltransferase [Salpingoeca rosetta]
MQSAAALLLLAAFSVALCGGVAVVAGDGANAVQQPPATSQSNLIFRMCFLNGGVKNHTTTLTVDVTLISIQSGHQFKLFSGILAQGCSNYATDPALFQGAFFVQAVDTKDRSHLLFNRTEDLAAKGVSRFTLWYDMPSDADFISTEPSYDKHLLNYAYVRVLSLSKTDEEQAPPLRVLTRNTNCHRCIDTVLAEAGPFMSATPYLTVQTNFPQELSVANCTPTPGCTPTVNNTCACVGYNNQTYHFGERGFYTLIVSSTAAGDSADSAQPHLQIVRDVRGDADHGPDVRPVFIALGIIVGLFVLWYAPQNCCPRVARALYPHTMLMEQKDEQMLLLNTQKYTRDPLLSSTHAIGNPKRSKTRLQSLDSFRGMALTIMIFVNYGGGDYNFFDHSVWNGLTVADLVFPWFIWIMGTSMAITFNSLFKRHTPLRTILYKVARRTLLLFGIGVIFINVVHDLRFARVPGVLQRFAIAYLVVALVIIFVPKAVSLLRNVDEVTPLIRRLTPTVRNPASDLDPGGCGMLRHLPDVAPYVGEWIAIIVLVVIHTCITFLLPVPGCPTGYIGPGGALAEFGQFAPANGSCVNGTFCCEGGAAGHVDRWLLSWKHIYGSPTSQETYQTGAYDPEGILGSLTSILICYLGLQSGKIIVHYKAARARSVRWLAWGVLCCAIATGLCGGSKNDGVIPVSKNLWSLSFVLLMSGFGFISLTAFYWLIDIWRVWDGAPFRYVGLNSIFIYVFHETFQEYFPFSWAWTDGVTHGKLMFMNVCAVSILILICYYCFKIDFFVKI